MPIQTTENRQLIPTLDESKLISLDETRLQKVGAKVAGVLGTIGAGVLTFIGLTVDEIKERDPGLVLASAGIILAVSILAWAIVSAADISARGRATAANLALRALPSSTAVVAPSGEPGGSAGLWAHIKGRESEDWHFVVGTRQVDDSGEVVSQLLLARNDEDPTWKPLSDLDKFKVETD